MKRFGQLPRHVHVSCNRPQHASVVLECPDQLGLVANVAQMMARKGGNITSLDQYLAPTDEIELKDPHPSFRDWWREDHPTWFSNNFLLRFEFSFDRLKWSEDSISQDFKSLEKEVNGTVSVRFDSKPMSVALLASKSDHCAAEILYRWRSGELRCKIPVLISNHTAVADLATQYDVPFSHLPTSQNDKREEEILKEVSIGTDFLVLARYMQILSPNFLHAYHRPIINIHHGLLPAFKGARPYEQMYRAGVKIIGATAHYVTPQLDEGPIIHQDVAPVNHRLTAAALKQVGIGLERSALVQAVKKHLDNKLVRFGDRVIVFS